MALRVASSGECQRVTASPSEYLTPGAKLIAEMLTAKLTGTLAGTGGGQNVMPLATTNWGSVDKTSPASRAVLGSVSTQHELARSLLFLRSKFIKYDEMPPRNTIPSCVDMKQTTCWSVCVQICRCSVAATPEVSDKHRAFCDNLSNRTLAYTGCVYFMDNVLIASVSKA